MGDMHKLQAIIAREFLERVRTRWFVIITLLGPILLSAILFLPLWLASRDGGSRAPGLVLVLDATGADETSWGNPVVTQALLNGVKAQGFKSIRIPVTWGQHQGAAPGYTVDAAYLSRVKEVVDWALADGFYVMINIHHDSWQWINTMPSSHDSGTISAGRCSHSRR